MDNFANFINGSCYLCNKNKNVICDRCLSKLTFSEDVCIVCSEPATNGITHSKCMSNHTPNLFKSLLKYNEYSSRILIKSKYDPYEFYLLKFLIKKYGSQISIPKEALLCPIPLSSLKMFERRFNQAELIAEEISKINKNYFENLLKRNSDTTSLYLLGSAERKKELRNVFGPRIYTKWYKNYPICLVDDLKTTGQTFFEATKVLRLLGFENVSAFSLFLA